MTNSEEVVVGRFRQGGRRRQVPLTTSSPRLAVRA